MDGENNGKPYEQMDDLGGKPTIFGNILMTLFKKPTSSEDLKKNNSNKKQSVLEVGSLGSDE